MGKPTVKRAKPKPKPTPTAEVSAYLAEIGSRGGKIGGRKRALTLSKKRRSEIARQGGKARALKAGAKKKAA